MKKIFTKDNFMRWKEIFKDTFTGFLEDKGLKLSASLSYYTLFSIAPLLLLIISVAGIFLGADAAQGKLFSEINGLLGDEAAAQVQEVIANLRLNGKSTKAVIIGSVTLLIGATTVFGEIQDSINMIWRVKAKPKRGWIKMIKDRLMSSSLIVVLGFLLLVTLLVNGILSGLGDYLRIYIPYITLVVFNVLNVVIGFGVIAILFGTIFKVLPDAKIAWKDVRVGAFFTAILFMLGRYGISFYIETAGTASLYGAAGSIIIILLWVYYTAAILYLGAEFTRAYADHSGIKIIPAEYAVFVKQTEVELEGECIELGTKEKIAAECDDAAEAKAVDPNDDIAAECEGNEVTKKD